MVFWGGGYSFWNVFLGNNCTTFFLIKTQKMFECLKSTIGITFAVILVII